MWYFGREPSPKAFLRSRARPALTFLLLALLFGCENATPEAPGRSDATAPVGDATVGPREDVDAANLPTRDAEVVPLDAGAAVDLDARVVADATFDGSVSPPDAGPARDAAVLPFVCNVPAPASCPSPAPRYPEIAAIIKQRCASCHSPLWTGPWPLDTYGHVADWQATIQANLLDCTMPPPEAGVPMTVDERVSILTWIRCGLPQ